MISPKQKICFYKYYSHKAEEQESIKQKRRIDVDVSSTKVEKYSA